MNNVEILGALKEAFNDAYLRQTGGGIECPCVPVGDNGAYALVTDEEAGEGFPTLWKQGLMLGYYDEDADDFDPDNCLVADGLNMEEALVKLFALRARSEIWGDFEPNELAGVMNFSDLHDKCDANMYLQAALLYYGKRFPQSDPWPFLNAVIETLESAQLGTFKYAEV